jgi:hypothetical protein
VTLANLERLVFAANVSVAWLDSAAGVDLVDLLPALDMPPAAAEAEVCGCSCSSCMRDRRVNQQTECQVLLAVLNLTPDMSGLFWTKRFFCLSLVFTMKASELHAVFNNVTV